MQSRNLLNTFTGSGITKGKITSSSSPHPRIALGPNRVRSSAGIDWAASCTSIIARLHELFDPTRGAMGFASVHLSNRGMEDFLIFFARIAEIVCLTRCTFLSILECAFLVIPED